MWTNSHEEKVQTVALTEGKYTVYVAQFTMGRGGRTSVVDDDRYFNKYWLTRVVFVTTGGLEFNHYSHAQFAYRTNAIKAVVDQLL